MKEIRSRPRGLGKTGAAVCGEGAWFNVVFYHQGPDGGWDLWPGPGPAELQPGPPGSMGHYQPNSDGSWSLRAGPGPAFLTPPLRRSQPAPASRAPVLRQPAVAGAAGPVSDEGPSSDAGALLFVMALGALALLACLLIGMACWALVSLVQWSYRRWGVPGVLVVVAAVTAVSTVVVLVLQAGR